MVRDQGGGDTGSLVRDQGGGLGPGPRGGDPPARSARPRSSTALWNCTHSREDDRPRPREYPEGDRTCPCFPLFTTRTPRRVRATGASTPKEAGWCPRQPLAASARVPRRRPQTQRHSRLAVLSPREPVAASARVPRRRQDNVHSANPSPRPREYPEGDRKPNATVGALYLLPTPTVICRTSSASAGCG